jgi:multidrug efflux pump subunit AcrA (membrane-fusion protein)
MSKRYAVLGFSVVLALALAVPALGGPSNPIASISASVKQTANKALKQSKQAKKLANTANSNANKAQETAEGAKAAADAAQASANGAKTTADGAQTTASSAQTSANGAKKIAEEAKAAAAAANENANSRIEGSYANFGEATEENTTTSKFAGAECDSASDPILGGGFFVGGTSEQVTVNTSEIDPFYGDSWFVGARAISGTPSWSLQASILCGFK